MSKVKIAFLISALDEGGMGRVLEMLSLGLPDDEYEQYIILLIKGREINFKYKGKIVYLSWESKNIFGKSFVFINRIKRLIEIKRKYKFDVVLSFGARNNFLNYVTKNEEKVIMSQHNVASIEHCSWGWYGKLCDLFLKSYSKSDALVSVSRYVENDLRRVYNIKNDNMSVIYNGLDIKFIRKQALENVDAQFMQGKINLVCVARLAKSKGIWHALKVMPLLIEKIPNIQLVVIGDGELHDYLKDLSKRLGIEEYVVFLGARKNPFPYVAKCDVFLFPSIYEGFSMAFLEAMALGVPVVAADCKAGPREVLADNVDYENKLNDVYEAEYGVLTPIMSTFYESNNLALENEEKIFAKAILNLLTNDKKMEIYKEKAMKRCNDFSQDCMVDGYVRMLKCVMRNGDGV